MRPSAFTDGNVGNADCTSRSRTGIVSSCFNEAVGFHRRKPHATCPATPASMRPSASPTPFRIYSGSGFNEAVGFHRRKRSGTTSRRHQRSMRPSSAHAISLQSIHASMRPSAFTDGNSPNWTRRFDLPTVGTSRFNEAVGFHRRKLDRVESRRWSYSAVQASSSFNEAVGFHRRKLYHAFIARSPTPLLSVCFNEAVGFHRRKLVRHGVGAARHPASSARLQ